MVNGLRGIYYSGSDHNTQLVERTDPTINFSWVHASPDPLLPVDDFSVRWFARIQPRYTERYTLSIVSDDGARLMINGQYLFDRWVTQSSVENSGQIDLVAGQLYDIQIDYFDQPADGAGPLLLVQPIAGEGDRPPVAAVHPLTARAARVPPPARSSWCCS